MSDNQPGTDRAQGRRPTPTVQLARHGAFLASGLVEPLAATIAACREILAYVNRHAVMTGQESDISEEVAKLNALLDEAYSKLAAAVKQAREEAEAFLGTSERDGKDVRTDRP